MAHILIVEDEPRMAQTLVKGIQKAGFQTTVYSNGLVARADNLESFDLVILDWMLPGISGLEVIREWRKRQITKPVLMLTAKGETPDKVMGLETGADDYLSKFFEWDELIARINALLRRTDIGQLHQLGEITLDRENREFTEMNKRVHLTPTEFEILKYFFDHPGRLVTRTSLVRAVYDQAANPFSNVIDRHIKSIRQKCTYDPILTVRGFGYRLNLNPTTQTSTT